MNDAVISGSKITLSLCTIDCGGCIDTDYLAEVNDFAVL